MPDSKRSFKFVGSKDEEGRYKGRTPSQAAGKAYSMAVRRGDIKAGKSARITVRETTSGSKNKEFSYNVKRVKLDTPVTVGTGKKARTIKHKNVVHKAK